jgi:hypothetical protein
VAFKSTDFKGHISILHKKASAMNIKFTYRYRDYANYKKYNEVIFSNPSNKLIHEIEQFILDHLFDDRLFYSTEWKLPDLHFEDWDPDIDHFVHEFESVRETDEEPSIKMTVEEFFDVIEDAHNNWKL